MLKHGSSLLLAGGVATALTIMLGGVVPAQNAPVRAHTQAVLPAAATSEVGADDAWALQKSLDAVIASGSVGAVAELRDTYRGVWRATAGVSDRVNRTAVDPGTRFRVASISKTFMAALVLKLVDDGELRLTDSVESQLPGLVTGGAGITVRNLLQHTSGIYNYSRAMPSVISDPLHHYEPEELVAVAEEHGSQFEPGSRYSYSNTNYVLLAMIVEKVTERPYAEVMAERIFQPLGLSATSVPGDENVPSPFLKAYEKTVTDGTTAWHDLTEFDPTRWYGTAQLISTTADVNKFFTALLAGELFSDARLADMKKVFADGGNDDYGLGIVRKRLSCGVTVWMHSGGIPGYRTWSAHSEGGQRHLTMFHSLYEGPASAPAHAMLETAFCHIPMASVASPATRSGIHAWKPGAASAFAVNKDKALSVARLSGSTWKVSRYGGTLKSNISVASGAHNEVRVYAANSWGRLAEFRGTATSGGWRVLPYTITSSPSAMASGPGRYHIYFRGGDGRLKHVSVNGSKVSQSDMGLAVRGSPALVPNGPNAVDVFVADTSYRVRRLSWANGRWTRTVVGGRVTSSPAAATMGDGRYWVFARGTDRELWAAHNASGSWSWREIGGTMIGSPAVSAYGEGKLRVIAVNGSGRPVVHAGSFTSATWELTTMGGTLNAAPAMYRLGPEDLRLVATTSASLYHGVVGSSAISWSRLAVL